MEIIQYQENDREKLIQLWKLCFPNEPLHNEHNSVINRKTNINDGLFFIVKDNDKDNIIGSVLAGYDGVRGWIYHLATHPDYRRMGIGRKLVNHIVKTLSIKGCIKINLQVRKSNYDVIEFYKKIGFTQDDVVSFGMKIK